MLYPRIRIAIAVQRFKGDARLRVIAALQRGNRRLVFQLRQPQRDEQIRRRAQRQQRAENSRANLARALFLAHCRLPQKLLPARLFARLPGAVFQFALARVDYALHRFGRKPLEHLVPPAAAADTFLRVQRVYAPAYADPRLLLRAGIAHRVAPRDEAQMLQPAVRRQLVGRIVDQLRLLRAPPFFAGLEPDLLDNQLDRVDILFFRLDFNGEFFPRGRRERHRPFCFARDDLARRVETAQLQLHRRNRPLPQVHKRKRTNRLFFRRERIFPKLNRA